MTAKKRKKIKGQKLNAHDLQREVAKYLHKHPNGIFSARQLIKKLKIANDKPAIEQTLEKLVSQGKAARSGNQFSAPSGGRRHHRGQALTGTVDMTRTGSAFIIVEGRDDDIFVRASDLRTALDGDMVEVQEVSSRNGRPRGVITRVVERSRDQFIGTYYAFKTYGVVVPDHAKVPFDILISTKIQHDAEHGDKVVAEVTKWSEIFGKAPEGRIILRLGDAGSSDIEMKGILLDNGFNLVFPDAVLQEAKQLPEAPSEEDKKGRRDFRDVPTFTIDPITAKDFDDALSVRHLENGNIEIGVHIADVTHFVKPGSAIDKEAYRRATSVYLVDRVAPMLPEELSNALCSLRPDEESLCFSVVFEFDKNHNIVGRWYGKTIIYSDRRFAYEEAQQVLDKGTGDHAREMQILNDIATTLRERKLKNGALMFETDEVQFVLDEGGVPIEVFAKERKEAHLLIEDFMLLANREVAAFIGKIRQSDKIPFVYRIHDRPDQEKIEELARFARIFGFEMKVDTPAQISKSFNALAEAARTDEALMVLEPLAIRTMAKAEYNVENIGHYGLAFDYYTHFTSPIRRYSDVLVHRLLHANIDGRTHRVKLSELQDQCTHISACERRAQKAERDSIKYKQAEYMKQFVGQQFNGFVSGMIDRGFFVKLEHTHAEGMVSFDRLPEPYSIDGGQMLAAGLKTGKTLKMGDKVRVRILDANPTKRQIEMDLVE